VPEAGALTAPEAAAAVKEADSPLGTVAGGEDAAAASVGADSQAAAAGSGITRATTAEEAVLPAAPAAAAAATPSVDEHEEALPQQGDIEADARAGGSVQQLSIAAAGQRQRQQLPAPQQQQQQQQQQGESEVENDKEGEPQAADLAAAGQQQQQQQQQQEEEEAPEQQVGSSPPGSQQHHQEAEPPPMTPQQQLIADIQRSYGVGLHLEGEAAAVFAENQQRLGLSVRRLAGELYSRDIHFVMELVQVGARVRGVAAGEGQGAGHACQGKWKACGCWGWCVSAGSGQQLVGGTALTPQSGGCSW
jgi:hypothetical protein